MSRGLTVFTPAKGASIQAIAAERPNLIAGLRAWLAVVLEDLTLTVQGRIVTETEANDLRGPTQGEAVRRMLAVAGSSGEDEDLRESIVEQLARHLFAKARAGFVQRVVGATAN